MIENLNFGIWERLDDLESPELKKTAASLPKLVEAAFANSTLEKYKRGWSLWVEWSKQYSEISQCPADPFFVALYLNDLVVNEVPVSRIIKIFCGIRWAHISTGLKSPTDDPFVKLCLNGAKRKLSTTTENRKEPLSAEIIKEIVDKFGFTGNLLHLRTVVICILGFAGFFRSSELLDLKLNNMKRTAYSYEILVEKSKTDPLREGNIVYISATGKLTCPIFWLEKYIKETKLKDEDYLFCHLIKTKKGHNVHGHLKISYSTMRKTFKDTLGKVVGEEDIKMYGLHSLRSGGASAAANNDVSDRLISKHGRWSSSTSRDVYIKDSKNKRLKVSNSLGI